MIPFRHFDRTPWMGDQPIASPCLEQYAIPPVLTMCAFQTALNFHFTEQGVNAVMAFLYIK
jgi:hypothetical protein